MKQAPQEIRWAIGTSRVGRVLVGLSDRGLCAVLIGDDEAELVAELRRRFPHSALRRDAGAESAAMEVVRRIDHPGAPVGIALDARGTDFQRAVWDRLREIPCGETITYSELAARVGRPRAVRAAAAACAANPLAVVVPCHRVVARTGALTGYRWGVERKRRLLEEELTIDN